MKARIEKLLDEDKAFDVVTIDLKDQSTIADYLVIASGTSSRQISSLAEKVKEDLKSAGADGIRIEGASQGDWVLVDAGDIIVHLFRPEVREFYSIEKLWGAVAPTPSTEALA